MVLLVKRILQKILGKQKLNYEETLTFLMEVKGVINSRPLCYIYDKNVDNIITPSHLVFGRRLLTQIQGNKSDQPTVENIIKRAQNIKNILKYFWKRFQNEYLTKLRERHKNINRSAKCKIEVGELVLINDENLKRHRWRAAVVEELISSKDGYIRWCKLRITNNK